MAVAKATALGTRTCSRCGERKPLEDFYFVSRKLGTRRGQCKPCMAEIKAIQKDPDWKPSCSRCGQRMERFGPGRRLCRDCFDQTYDEEDERSNGAHRLKLNPCSACGAKRLRGDHAKGSSLCPICRSVPQGRRSRLSRFFNMSPRDYLALLEDQSYRCWTCQRLFTKQRNPHVDHSHREPRIIRGLVCSSCNTILALSRDNPETLRGCAKYLEVPPAQYVFPGLTAAPEADRKTEGYAPLKRVWG